MKKPLFLLPLVAALCSLSLPAQSADYHVVVPAPGKAAPYASIKLELNPANLPVGMLGEPYAGFDFNTALRITGDAELDMSQVSWSRYSGELPDGLSLARDGSLSGTPTEAGSSTFQALAKYKTKTVVGTYMVDVEAQTKIMDYGSARYWEDGTFAQSCLDYRQPTKPYHYAGDTGDGIYRIQPAGSEAFDVRCDMTTDGGGWTIFQRRFDGSVDFYQSFANYITGFGAVSGEYWLGLENIRHLASSNTELRVELSRANGEHRYANYSGFNLGPAPGYNLNIAQYLGGNVEDALLGLHNGAPFSTYDNDQDSRTDNVTELIRSAGWFFSNYTSNLNGTFGHHYAVSWSPWTPTYGESLSTTEMKIR